ncbi:Uncharacterised protein [Mycobacteroides abscessus subsp. massiliense]|nr:Uncharacterised protein [Mycobacteroides abscessus subsp. massiliense]
MMNSGPTALRTALTTSTASLRRFFGLPPNSSLRSLVYGARNWLMK